MEFGIWGVGEMALRVRVGGGWRVAGGVLLFGELGLRVGLWEMAGWSINLVIL